MMVSCHDRSANAGADYSKLGSARCVVINPRVRRKLLKKNKQVANKRAPKNYTNIMRFGAGNVNAVIASPVTVLRAQAI
jgi:hypothetical protein